MARLGIAGAGSSMGTNAVDVPKNIIDQQEELKSWPDDRLVQELQSPSGSAPQYLVFTEVGRRKDVRGKYQAEMAKHQQPQMSMAQEAVMARMAPPMQPPMPPPGGSMGPGGPMPPMGPGGPMGPPPGGPMGPPPGGPMPPMTPGGIAGMAGGGPVRGFANGSSGSLTIGEYGYGPYQSYGGGDFGFGPLLTDPDGLERARARLEELEGIITPGAVRGHDMSKYARERNLLREAIGRSSPSWMRAPGTWIGEAGESMRAKREAFAPIVEEVTPPGVLAREEEGIIRGLGLTPSRAGAEFAPSFPLGWSPGSEPYMTAEGEIVGGSSPEQLESFRGLAEELTPQLTEADALAGVAGLDPSINIPLHVLGQPSPGSDAEAPTNADAPMVPSNVTRETPSDIARIRELLESRENPGNESWKTAAMLKAAQAFLSKPTFAGAAGEAFGGTAGVIEDMEKRDESRRLANIQNQIALAGLEQTERRDVASREYEKTEKALDREAKRDIAILNNEARSLLYAENNDARLEQLEEQMDITIRSEERQQVAKAVADFYEDNKDVYDTLAMMEDGPEKQQQEALIASRYTQLISGVKSALSPRSVGMKRGMKHGGVVRGVLGRP